jgi:hypothetical protein
MLGLAGFWISRMPLVVTHPAMQILESVVDASRHLDRIGSQLLQRPGHPGLWVAGRGLLRAVESAGQHLYHLCELVRRRQILRGCWLIDRVVGESAESGTGHAAVAGICLAAEGVVLLRRK